VEIARILAKFKESCSELRALTDVSSEGVNVMSPQSDPNPNCDPLWANPLAMPMMAFCVAVAICLDVADALAWRDALSAFPVKKV